MIRAQCIVHRDNKVLMVRHRLAGKEWWCLPGGAVEAGESPDQAALRELREECGLKGTIVRQMSVYASSNIDTTCTYLVDIGRQEPRTGSDPEFGPHEQVLVEARWLLLSQIPERDRAFLWAAGLLAIDVFMHQVSQWGSRISYPGSGT
jgi:ADP-ribose pyrophosphatase YjhB (NUDIX family)